MKILKVIFFIPYWVVYYAIAIPNLILTIACLLWSALGARIGLEKAKFNNNLSNEERLEFVNTITTLVNGEEDQND